jgi:hypothetical protein
VVATGRGYYLATCDGDVDLAIQRLDKAAATIDRRIGLLNAIKRRGDYEKREFVKAPVTTSLPFEG